MSTISGISPASYTPSTIQVKPATVASQPTTPTVQSAAKDADGDNDGSKGNKIDVHA